jgi:hypothetical protein
MPETQGKLTAVGFGIAEHSCLARDTEIWVAAGTELMSGSVIGYAPDNPNFSSSFPQVKDLR